MDIEIAVKEPKLFRVDGTEYKIQYPLANVVELEKKIGRSMKHSVEWFKLSTGEVHAALWAGLLMYHPLDAEDVAGKIVNNLDPENIETVIQAICEVACPAAMERLREAQRVAVERMKKGLSSVPAPNALSVAAVN
jgi:hypothetical protein